MVREDQFIKSDRVVQLLVIRPLEGELAAKEGKEEDS